MRETSLCAKYAFINRHIQSIEQLQIHSVIQAFVKNYREDRVYCSLNIGLSGIIMDENSIKQLRTFFDIGDIIQVQVEGFKTTHRSTYVVLKFLGP